MEKNNKKKLIIAAAAAVVLVFGWRIYQRISSSGSKRPQGSGSVAVEVASVKTGTVRDAGLFTGSLLPKSQFVVAPKVNGWLEKLLVNVGDVVKRDQLIAILDDDEFAQQVEQDRAELEVAKATLENCTSNVEIAEREYQRAKTLREKQVASESEMDEAETSYNSSQSKLKVAQAILSQREAALKTALVRLSYTQITARWEEDDQTRVVGEKFVDEGSLLKENEPIVSILENRILTGVIYVIERDYPKIRINQKATIKTDAYPGRTFTGQIIRIAPMLKESSRQARVEIEIDNKEETLKPGMFVRVEIEYAVHENVTLVPTAALVERSGIKGVFTADTEAKKARFVPVTIGVIEGDAAEIVEPKLSGMVVTMGQHLIEDGSGIKLPDSSKAGERQ